jgi:hypothetical protein
MAQERRRRRSTNAKLAITYQLAHVRKEACLDAIVLADKDGLVVAEAGDVDLCDSLAAVAPLVSRGALPAHHTLPNTYMQVREVDYEGTPLYLASCTESFADTLSGNTEVWLEHMRAGISRILAA